MGALRGRRGRVAARQRARLSGVPEHERVEQAGRRAAGGGELEHDDRRDRPARHRAPGFRHVPGLRHPDQRRRGLAEAKARHVRLVRARVRPCRLSDSEAPQGRARLRRAHAHRRPRPLPSLRALPRAQDAVRLARRFGRDVEPEVEPPAPRRLDERRRGRPPDPARPRAVERGQEGRDRPRAARHRPAARAPATSTRPATTRAREAARTIRRWGCACACRRRSTRRATASAGPGHRRRDAAVRHHRGRQRYAVVRPGCLERPFQQ